jgi:D-3-phosphoglycerate dehydrogenase
VNSTPFLCGDDEITRAVLDKSLPRLRVISKYGIGLDKIDVAACTEKKLPVLFTPGVNHTTVAEHTFCLLLALVRNLVDSANSVRNGQWKRVTGHEIWNKTIGIVGLGRIGQEVAKRAAAFGMKIHAMDLPQYWPKAFADEFGVTQHEQIETMLPHLDVLSLHANLSESTRHLVNAERLKLAKPELIILNTSRAELVHMADLIAALDAGPTRRLRHRRARRRAPARRSPAAEASQGPDHAPHRLPHLRKRSPPSHARHAQSRELPPRREGRDPGEQVVT